MCAHQLDFEEATKSFVAARDISHHLGEDRACLLLDILTFLSDRRPGIKLLTQERIATISNTLKEAVKKPHDFFITCCHALFLLLRGEIGEAVEYMESYGSEISVSEDLPNVQIHGAVALNLRPSLPSVQDGMRLPSRLSKSAEIY